ncbi:MAG: biotin--[acetyl-CoA-carboxylase] ligase [Pyrinomonas methylaliphatogenes]|nr:biotin--[acetyl-CoA-carboxylase] ligase [Pyrinomonas methylaliphatogenes]
MELKATILRYESLPSTNTEAANQARRGAPEGLCIVARAQTQGRGRQGRTWASPPGAGLYFSIVLRPRIEARWWPLLSLLGALASRDALREACALVADIKWPNDLLVEERKIGGVLAEVIETEFGRACILGIGLNLRDGAFPPEIRATATSVERVSGEAPDTETVLQALVRAIADWYGALHAPAGPERICREWEASSSYAFNRRVRATVGSETIEGLTRGLELDGALRLETEDGRIERIYSADIVSLRGVAG